MITVHRARAYVRVPWRLRLRSWWHRRRAPERQLELEDELARRLERALLFGEDE